MSTGNPDLFVICKSCGSEVSPYITECPYCGNRLRKRAPKLDRQGRVTEKRRRRPPAPSLPRLRRGEIPGIRPESRPYASIVLLLAGLVGALLWRTGVVHLDQIVIIEKPGSHWWRLITAPFVYNNTGYAFVVLGAIALYGWLLERRHGALPVVVLFAIGGVGGTAATAAAYPVPSVLGGNGAALALIVAWAIPDLLSLRRGEEIEGDLLGTAVIGAAVALMPLVVSYPGASWISDAVGALGGAVVGLPLALTQDTISGR
jgi:membrane associated rhomboid family serine protease